MALIAHWPLNGNTNDISGNGYNGTASGAVVNSLGKIGQCYYFDGVDDYIYRSHEAAIDLSNEITIAVWVKFTVITSGGSFNGGIIASKGHWSTDGWHFGIDWENLYFSTYDGINEKVGYATSNFTIGSWYHIVGRLKSDGNIQIFVNGLSVASANTTKQDISAPTYDLRVGKGYSNKFNGYINDFRLYDTALTDMEIQEIARAKILHYTFNDMQEPTINLSSPTDMSNNIDAVNGATSVTNKVLSNGRTGIEMIQGTTADILSITIPFDNSTIIAGKSLTFSALAKCDKNDFLKSQITVYIDGVKNWLQSDGITWNTNVYEYNNIFNGFTSLNRWIRIEHTIKLPTSGALTSFSLGGYYRTTGTWTMEITDVQTELKDHSTEFIEGSRTGIVRDFSGYGHDAPMDSDSSPEWREDSALGIGSYNFDVERILWNENHYLTDSLTLSCWVKLDTIRESGFIQSDFYLSCGSDGKLRAYWYSTSNAGYHTSPNVLPVGEWIHIAATWTGTEVILYENGVAVKTVATNTPGRATNGYTAIGTESSNWPPTSSRQINGSIDDVRIYATGLSAKDIKDLYETRMEIEESGVIYAKDFNVPINYLDPERFFSYEETGNQDPGYQIYDGKSVWRVYPHWFHPDYAYLGEDAFKENTSYRIHVELVHNTYYATNEIFVAGGLILHYTDASRENLYYTPTAIPDEWRTYDIITDPLKTVSYISVYYYTSQIVYITTDSYIVENSEGFYDTGVIDAPDISTIGITDGLIGYWTLNNNVKDYSGNNYDGVNDGAISRTQYYEFDGASKIDLPTLPQLDDLTVLAKIRRGSSTWDGIFGTYSATENRMHFQLTSSGYMNTYLYGTIGAGVSGIINIPLDGEFHLVAVTYDQSYVRVYVDGTFDAETSDTGGNLPSGSGYMIGISHDATRYYEGDIAYIKLFNRALTAEEIAIEYNTMINNEVQIHKSGKVFAKDIRQY